MKGRHKKIYKLKKSLTLLDIVLYGIGIILGAGIYVLLGSGSGLAGNAIWISFAIAALMALFTGLSYAELSSMYPKEAAEYVYTEKAFGKKYLSFLVSWVLIVAGIVSASTVALGFGRYFTNILGGNPVIIAAILIVLLSLMNYSGIKDSARLNAISSVIEVLGLLIIIAIGIFFIGKADINYFEMSPLGFAGVMSAVSLIYFAFIGFESIVNISEEVKNARKNIPKGLMISLAISTIIYILVSFSAVSILGWEKLSQSKAPMADVMNAAFPQASLIMTIIALFATLNTVLIILIVTSRIMYGMSRRHSLPAACSRICKKGTPYISIFAAMMFSLLALSIGSMETIALLTTLGIFIIYIFVNISLIYLRYKKPDARRRFRSPLNIGKFPVLAAIGIAASFIMLTYFDPVLIAFEVAVMIAGLFIYKIFNH